MPLPERGELLRVGMAQFAADLPAGLASGRRGGSQKFEQSPGDGIDLDEADAISAIAIDDELRRLRTARPIVRADAMHRPGAGKDEPRRIEHDWPLQQVARGVVPRSRAIHGVDSEFGPFVLRQAR